MSKKLSRLLVLMVIFISLLFTQPGKNLVHKLDTEFFQERILDVYGRIVTGEDWGAAAMLGRKMDYGWLGLSAEKPYFRVAHALGYEPVLNSEVALLNSIKAGYRFVEVDVWLDQAGLLRCHHGPDLPPAYKRGDCTFSSLLDYVVKDDIWLVVDTKSDFQKTGNQILTKLRSNSAAKHVIFQLYLPEHLAVFNAWAQEVPLPGPIVTTYLSHRSLSHVFANVERVGIKAVTFPLSRRGAMPASRPSEIFLFTHPVHDCGALKQARDVGVFGIYSTSTLTCD